MFPKPKPVLVPNTYAYRIRADGEGDRLSRIRRALAVRQGNQPDGRAGARHGAGRADRGTRRQAGDRHRPRFPRLFGLDQIRADLRPDGGGLQGARHRACGDADGLFRAVRSRRALRRHGHGLAQRQRLDRRQDGRQPAADLRSRRDDAAEGDRAQRRVQEQGRRLLSVPREFPGALHRRPHQSPETQAQAEGRGRLRQRHRGRVRAAGDGGDRLRGDPARHRARSYLPEIQSESRRHGDAARDPRRGARSTRPMSASASTATAIAAAWSTTPARRSSPTRSA